MVISRDITKPSLKGSMAGFVTCTYGIQVKCASTAIGCRVSPYTSSKNTLATLQDMCLLKEHLRKLSFDTE